MHWLWLVAIISENVMLFCYTCSKMRLYAISLLCCSLFDFVNKSVNFYQETISQKLLLIIKMFSFEFLWCGAASPCGMWHCASVLCVVWKINVFVWRARLHQMSPMDFWKNTTPFQKTTWKIQMNPLLALTPHHIPLCGIFNKWHPPPQTGL